ncbi:MAG: alpha/beta fold hydrolase [Hyphomicrobiaceae bacterium]
MTNIDTVPLIPRRILFGNPSRVAPSLSRDGKWLSWLAPRDGVLNIWLAPVGEIDAARPLTAETARPIAFHTFARTNQHVLYFKDNAGDENFHLWCADFEGNTRDLTPYGDVTVRWYGVHFDNPTQVAIGINDRDARWHDLYVIDIETGERRRLHENASEISNFILDTKLGLRLATRTRPQQGGHVLLKWNGRQFEQIAAVDMEDDLGTHALHFNVTGDAWYQLTTVGRETSVLERVEWTTGHRAVIAEHPHADISHVQADPRTREVTAAAATYIRDSWIGVDPTTAGDIAFLEKFLAADIYVSGTSGDANLWLVMTTRADSPVVYYLFERPTRTVRKLFAARPELDGAKLAPMQGLIIKSRDGLDMVSYLTLPASETAERPARPLPMVLLVHGGPMARDSYGYNPQHQWLANRGYAVLSVNYRGSTGLGKSFLNAAIREWAGRMHDDLIDAVEWAIAEGIADRSKVAIMGGSYGGYATLVGLTFTPDVFCCGVDIVGPSNLETLLATIPPYWAAFFDQLARRVGDPRTEEGRKLLAERSPVHRAGAIVRPLLIGQGANDPRVKQAESDQIVAAMQAKDLPVTYVLYPDEGHGFARPENRLSFNAITEAFLARHLGGRLEPVGNDFDGASLDVKAGADLLADLGIPSRS